MPRGTRKGCALDLHPLVFEVERCAATIIAHIAAHLRKLGPEDHLLTVPRSYAEHLLAWAHENG
jgi:sarcosine oxidase subunit gamma